VRTEVIACAIAAATGLAPTVIALAPAEGKPVAVIVAPWQPREAALRITAAAGGRLLMMTSTGVVTTADADGDGFVGRLYAAGAILVLNAAVVPACLRTSSFEADQWAKHDQ
jgi:ABC-type branched-subunit amino acid transport system substrate-binding protein